MRYNENLFILYTSSHLSSEISIRIRHVDQNNGDVCRNIPNEQ